MRLQSALVSGSASPSAIETMVRAQRPVWLRLDAMLAALAISGAMLWVAASGMLAPVAECRVPPVVLAFGGETTVPMTIEGGRPCTVAVQIASGAIERFSISEQPKHGTLIPRGRTGVVYVPARRFRGTDSFAFELAGRSNRAAGTMTVRGAVTVR